MRTKLCAALLLMHLLFMNLAAAKKRTKEQRPIRGWKAAREAEQRRLAAAAAAAGAAEWPPSAGPGLLEQLPAADAELAMQQQLQQGRQEACSAAWLEQRPVAPLGWPGAMTAAAAAFVLGLLAGMALQAWMQRRRWRQRQQRAPSREEGAASCSPAKKAAASPGAGKQQAQPAGASAAGAGGGQQAALEAAGSSPSVTAAAPAVVAADVPAAAAAAATAADEGIGESPAAAAQRATEAGERSVAAEAAVAAAVQELVLRSTASASSASAVSSEAAAGAAASQAELATEQQLPQLPGGAAEGEAEAESESRQQPASLPLAPALAAPAAAAAAATAAAADGGALGALRPEDRADIQAAAQLVLTMCGSMHVDPGQLSRGERLQLIYTMLQAWQAQQARRHAEEMSRLGSEANLLRGQQRDIAARAAARQAAKDAYRLSLERTASFRRLCSDTLTCGLVVMAAAAAHQLARRGLLARLTAGCPSPAAALGGRWGMWALWRASEAAACCVLAIGDALLGLGVLLAAPWLVYRSGLLSDYHTMPFSKLLIGLGLACGAAGYLAVGKLGGSRGAWLAAWEAWVVLHVAFSAAAHRMHRITLRARQSAPGGSGGAAAAAAAALDAAGGMYEEAGGWLPAAMWLVLGLALPLLAGTLPFRLPPA